MSHDLTPIGAVVLAAGRGTRMKSTKPKVLHELMDRPMVVYTLETLNQLGLGEVVTVVGFQAERVKQAIREAGVKSRFAYQEKQLGTADAARVGVAALGDRIKVVLTLNADDSAFLTKETIMKMINRHQAQQGSLTVLTVVVPEPGSLGRILRDTQGRIQGVVEAKIASPEQLTIKEVNTNIYLFDRQWFAAHINKVKKEPTTGEYFLPDLLKLAVNNGSRVATLCLEDPTEFVSINRPDELQQADYLMRQKRGCLARERWDQKVADRWRETL